MDKGYSCLEMPDKDECARVIGEALSDPKGQPQGLEKQDRGDDDGHHSGAKRHAMHRGHKIEIKTTYELKIDGKVFEGHVMVDEQGRLHCHSVPYKTYGSAIDFAKCLIDIYPDSFPVPENCGAKHHE